MPRRTLLLNQPWAIAPGALESLLADRALWSRQEPGFIGRLLARMRPAAGAAGQAGAAADPGYELADNVALVRVRGVLLKRDPGFLGGVEITTYEGLRRVLAKALEDPAVHAVLLDVDSPGGQVDGCKTLADWIATQRGVKPMAAFADGRMLSAAFWLGAATGRVFAPAEADVGSIGVVWAHQDWSRFNENFGVRVTYMTGGRWKAAGNPDEPLSPEVQGYLQARVDPLYRMFVAGVAASLGLDEAQAAAWADGQFFIAEQARELGLVSAIATREQALAQLKEETMTQQAGDTPLTPLNPDQAQAQAAEKAKAALDTLAVALGVTSETLASALARVDLGAAPAKAPDTPAQPNGPAAAGYTPEQVQALAGAALGQDAADRLGRLMAAGLTPDQARAAAEVLAPAPGQGGDAASRAAILAGLLGQDRAAGVTPGAGGKPVAETPDARRAAMIDRMSKIPA